MKWLSLPERSAGVMRLDLFVCIYVCVWTRNSQTIAPIDLTCLHKK